MAMVGRSLHDLMMTLTGKLTQRSAKFPETIEAQTSAEMRSSWRKCGARELGRFAVGADGAGTSRSMIIAAERTEQTPNSYAVTRAV